MKFLERWKNMKVADHEEAVKRVGEINAELLHLGVKVLQGTFDRETAKSVLGNINELRAEKKRIQEEFGLATQKSTLSAEELARIDHAVGSTAKNGYMYSATAEGSKDIMRGNVRASSIPEAVKLAQEEVRRSIKKNVAVDVTIDAIATAKSTTTMKDTSPYAVCTAQVGREDADKYESCVMHVKQATKAYFGSSEEDSRGPEAHHHEEKAVGIGDAGGVPQSLLARQDLEGEKTTTKSAQRAYGAERYREDDAFEDLTKLLSETPNWLQAYVDYDADRGTFHACITYENEAENALGKSQNKFKKIWGGVFSPLK